MAPGPFPHPRPGRIGPGMGNIATRMTAAAALAALLAAGIPATAMADGYPDELLFGVFTRSRLDSTDMFYASRDGVHMELVGTAFEDATPDYDSVADEGGRMSVDGQSTLVNPSVTWHDSRFWLLGNHHHCDTGTVCLVMSSSTDLKSWTRQETVRVPVDQAAPGGDAVAADWAEDPSTGHVWASISIGDYGAFHDRHGDDMRPYLIEFDRLEDGDVEAGDAMRVHLPSMDGHDRIDGSLYFEDGTAYYSVKRDGRHDELWRSSDLTRCSDPSSWTLVSDDVAPDYEAPSLTRFNGRYRYYFDRLRVHPADVAPADTTGTYVMESRTLSGGWTAPRQLAAYDSHGAMLSDYGSGGAETTDGPRHGTVVTLRDPAAIRAVMDARGSMDPMPEDTAFTDVKNKAAALGAADPAATPHADDIDWLGSTGVTQGYPDGTFGGMTPTYRQDMAAFLRRRAVRMGVRGADSWRPSASDWRRFRDVDASTPHAEDILWLAHSGIGEGWVEPDGSRTFRGMDSVKRQDMAAFLRRLARLAGRGGAVRSGRFRDVDASTPHAADVRWLGGSGVAQGYPDGTFRGMTPVYRQDMAAFLHRLDSLA